MDISHCGPHQIDIQGYGPFLKVRVYSFSCDADTCKHADFLHRAAFERTSRHRRAKLCWSNCFSLQHRCLNVTFQCFCQLVASVRIYSEGFAFCSMFQISLSSHSTLCATSDQDQRLHRQRVQCEWTEICGYSAACIWGFFWMFVFNCMLLWTLTQCLSSCSSLAYWLTACPSLLSTSSHVVLHLVSKLLLSSCCMFDILNTGKFN